MGGGHEVLDFLAGVHGRELVDFGWRGLVVDWSERVAWVFCAVVLLFCSASSFPSRFVSAAKMGLKTSLTSLLLAAPLALAHSAKDIPLGPIERRDLNHCSRAFQEEEFMKRTVEIHGKEFARLRRNLGLDPEDMDTYGFPLSPIELEDHADGRQTVPQSTSGTTSVSPKSTTTATRPSPRTRT